MSNEQLDKLFPRDAYGRIALALSSCTLGPFAGALFVAIIYGEFFGRQPHDWLTSITLFAVAELAFAFTLFFVCGLIWAIATPRWLEGALRTLPGKLGIAFAATALTIAFAIIRAF